MLPSAYRSTPTKSACHFMTKRIPQDPYRRNGMPMLSRKVPKPMSTRSRSLPSPRRLKRQEIQKTAPQSPHEEAVRARKPEQHSFKVFLLPLSLVGVL
jgi:hypothetical protein